MWNLKDLIKHCSNVQAEIGGKWVPARPLNETKKHKPFIERLRDAISVFRCESEAFKWPNGQ